jgi:hypothetical protein
MVVKPEELAIPIIDLEPVHSGSPEEALATGRKVYDAFRKVGFAYIKNHGVPQELVDQAFEWVSLSIRFSYRPYRFQTDHPLERQILRPAPSRQGQSPSSALRLVASRLFRHRP